MNTKKFDKVIMKKKAGTTNRFFSSPQKRHLINNNNQSTLNNGGGDVSERSNKDKFGRRRRRRSGSDDDEEKEEEELRSSLPLLTTVGASSKRVKLHTKPLSDCNGVDHAVIPRKLRSAMSKRSRESLSPPLSDAKKHHHHTYNTNGTNPFQINAANKSKQKMKQGGSSHQFLGQGTSSQITKDEEEVVETLYALARMSPNNKHDKSRVDQPISKPKSCPLPETTENPVLSSEVPEELGKRTIGIEATNLSSSVSEESAKYGIRANSLTESSVLDRDTISANKKSKLGMYSSISPLDPRGSSLLSNTAHTEDIPMVIAAKSLISSEHGTSNRSTQATQHETSFSEQKPELMPVAANVMEQEGQPPIKNEDSDTRLTCIEGTLALWPRLSMAMPGGGEVPRSSATKASVCLEDATASIAKPISKEEVNPDLVDRKQSLKKCATHVYLSRLILVYQASEKKHMFSVASDQLKLNEGTKLGATEATSLIELNNGCNGLIPIDIRNGLNGVIAIGNTGKSMNEAQTGIAKDNRLQADRQQSSLNLTLEKQSCDFLSLSVSSGGMEPINDIKQEKAGLESSVQVRVPYLHPIVQNVQLMPFPYHARSSSSTYPDQLTVAVAQQFQLPQHMSGGPFYGQQHLIQAGSAKQHQQIWAAQYMPGGNPSTHLSKWQQGSSQRDSPVMISCAEPLLASSSLPPEVFSSKFPPGQQHQQQFFAVSSQSHKTKGKKQQQHPHHHQFSGVYEGGAGGLHSESRSNHLQLVCKLKSCNCEDKRNTPLRHSLHNGWWGPPTDSGWV